jgi:hypothetical protein
VALDLVFGSLVKARWDYQGEHAFASHIDEVFLGAVITACLDGGWSSISPERGDVRVRATTTDTPKSTGERPGWGFRGSRRRLRRQALV